MAFVFDTTISGTTTNSYPTIQEADDYFAGRFDNSLWPSNQTTKQRLLVTATRRIDQERFQGYKTLQAQSLQFPRTGTSNRDGFMVNSNVIPSNLKSAVFELAYFLLQSEDRTLSEIELHDSQFLKSYEVGPLKYQFSGAKMNTLPETVKAELRAMGMGVWIGEGATQIFL